MPEMSFEALSNPEKWLVGVLFNSETPLSYFQISEKTGKTVKLGRLNWQADSYHIYGKDIKEAKERLFDRIPEMRFEERTMPFSDPFILDMYNGAEAAVVAKIRELDNRQ